MLCEGCKRHAVLPGRVGKAWRMTMPHGAPRQCSDLRLPGTDSVRVTLLATGLQL